MQREHLHIQALDALIQLTQQALHTSNYAEVQTYARRQLALEPWREAAHRHLMLALARCGGKRRWIYKPATNAESGNRCGYRGFALVCFNK